MVLQLNNLYRHYMPMTCCRHFMSATCCHSAVKFPDVAGSVIQLLMDFLGDTNTASALDVIFFVREIVETNEKLRPAILARLLDSFTQIRSSRVRSILLFNHFVARYVRVLAYAAIQQRSG